VVTTKGLKTQALITGHFVGIIRLFLGVVPPRSSCASNVHCKFIRIWLYLQKI